MRIIMKTKLLILTLCAFALAACNEPGNPVDKNELIKDAMTISEKPYSEANEYLVNKDYAAWNYEVPKEGEWGFLNYCKPKKMAELSNNEFWTTLHNNPCQYYQCQYNAEGYIVRIDALQRTSSAQKSFAIYKSWVQYLEKYMTSETGWLGEIDARFVEKVDTINYIRSKKYCYYDGCKDSDMEQRMEYNKQQGYEVGSREDFERMLNVLSLDDFIDLSIYVILNRYDEQQKIIDLLRADIKYVNNTFLPNPKDNPPSAELSYSVTNKLWYNQ